MKAKVPGKYAHSETHQLKFERQETEWGKCDEQVIINST